MAFEKEKAAHAAGKRVQFSHTFSNGWCNITYPNWNCDTKYRIHPDDDVDPYAEVRAAEAAGLRVQILCGGKWENPRGAWNFNDRPEHYRIHPDDQPQQTGTTMNKQEARDELVRIQQSAKKLEAIINAPDVAPSLLTKPEPMSDDRYWSLDADRGAARVVPCNARRADSYAGRGNMFQSEFLAANYARATNTMLLLRHQHGTVPAEHGEQQFTLIPMDQIEVAVSSWASIENKMRMISPCFATREDAERAIQQVGKQAIIHMFNTLHHVG